MTIDSNDLQFINPSIHSNRNFLYSFVMVNKTFVIDRRSDEINLATPMPFLFLLALFTPKIKNY